MIRNAYSYLNFPPLPAQILLNFERLRKMWCWQLLKISSFACPNLFDFANIGRKRRDMATDGIMSDSEIVCDSETEPPKVHCPIQKFQKIYSNCASQCRRWMSRFRNWMSRFRHCDSETIARDSKTASPNSQTCVPDSISPSGRIAEKLIWIT